MLSFNCPHCNDTIRVEEKFAGQTGNCNHCHKPLTVPFPQPVQSFAKASPIPPAPLPVLAKAAKASSKPAPVICKVCDNGVLTRKKVYRLSGCAITIGYIFLIPSILGMLMGFFLLFATGSATTQVADVQNSAYKTELTDANIPAPMIKKLVNEQELTDAESRSITMDQATAIDFAKTSKMAGNIGAGAATGIAGGAALFIIISSFCSGLLGFLLTMKKRILQCNACQAVVNAS